MVQDKLLICVIWAKFKNFVRYKIWNGSHRIAFEALGISGTWLTICRLLKSVTWTRVIVGTFRISSKLFWFYGPVIIIISKFFNVNGNLIGLIISVTSICVQVYPDGIRHIRADKRVNEWKAPGKKTIVKCAVNQRQVVIALTGGELVYFEMDPVCIGDNSYGGFSAITIIALFVLSETSDHCSQRRKRCEEHVLTCFILQSQSC